MIVLAQNIPGCGCVVGKAVYADSLFFQWEVMGRYYRFICRVTEK